jgi:hypothetical protein
MRDSSSLPQNLPEVKSDLFEPLEGFEQYVVDSFSIYMRKKENTFVLFLNDEKKVVSASRASDLTRYSDRGRQRQRRKIKDRLGSDFYKAGVKLELTYSHDVSRSEAWAGVGNEVRCFLDRLNKIRGRKGIKSRLRYLSVIVSQPGSGYPHAHMVFPGLRSLMVDQKNLNTVWGHGYTWVRFAGQFQAASYACKYITKDERSYLGDAYMKFNKTHAYQFSRNFKGRPQEKSTGWQKPMIMRELDSLGARLWLYNGLGYSLDQSFLKIPELRNCWLNYVFP